MTEGCEAAINLELLRGMVIVILTIALGLIIIPTAVTVKRWLVDLAHYIDGGG